MKKLFNFGVHTINILWIIFFTLTVLFAFLSPNLILGDNETFGTSTTLITTGVIIFLVLFITSVTTFPTFRQKLFEIFITHKYKTASIFLILVLLWQIIFVYFVHPSHGFDVGMLHYAVVDKAHALEPNVRGYFSMNQNNLPVMLLMQKFVSITGNTSWEFFSYLTLFFVDLSVVLNIFTVRIVAPKALAFSMYFQGLGLLFFPTIIMPYTDAWALPLVSGFLLCYFLMSAKKYPLSIRISALILFAPLVILAYFIKPSAIIPVIAIFLVSLLFFITQTLSREKRTATIIRLVFFLLIGFGTYRLVNKTIEEQDYIQIDSSRNIPMIHFASMGIVGDGGYSEEQAEMMAILPTKEEKSKYSKDIIVERLKELGVSGYLSFLVKKHEANTADGTFGWLKEGNFITENQTPSNEGFANKLKNFVYLYGENIADFRFLAQLIWLVLLLIILLGWGNKKKEDLIFRLSLVGAFLFLLLFEGGRSRYLIQYLPCFVLLGSISWKNTLNRGEKIISWWRKIGSWKEELTE